MSDYKKLPAKVQLQKMRAALTKMKGKGDYRGFRPMRSLQGRGDYAPRRGFRSSRLRGRGDFFDDLGGVIGKGVGKLAASGGRSLAKMIGFGDYRIAPKEVPLFESHGRENSFVHREYLGDIFSSTTFTATTFNINPGLGNPASEVATMRGAFPWLAKIAQNYEEYRLDGMVFYYVPTSSDAVVASATTPALGSVSIASEYNSNKEDFTNITDMLNHQFSNSKKPSEMIAHPIECARKERPQEVMYVRSDEQTAADILHYDICKTTVAVTGCQANGQNLGQLWVTYKVTLLKPILFEQSEDPFVLTTHYELKTGIVTGTNYFGTTAPTEPVDGSTFEVTLSNAAATITFPADITSGNFLVGYRAVGASSTITNALTMTATTNCTGLSIFPIDNYVTYSNILSSTPAGATSTVSIGQVRAFTITGPSAVITLSSGTIPGSQVSGDVFITQFNVNVVDSPDYNDGKQRNFWRATKDFPNPPWAAKASEESRKRAEELKQQEFMNQMKTFMMLQQQAMTLGLASPLTPQDNSDKVSEEDLDLLRRIKQEKALHERLEKKESIPEGYVKLKSPSKK